MSLIISYIGSKGCVMIGDKRRIGFIGDEKNREIVEELLYSGKIKTKEALLKVANDMGISLKITDTAEKVRKIGDVLVGEVKFRTPQVTRRKRVYGTTNSYQIIKLTGSNIDSVEEGHISIVVFGNKITQKLANEAIKKHWKTNITLKDVGKLFEKIIIEVAKITPSLSPEYDLYTVTPVLDKKFAMNLLRNTIVQDVKELEQWRAELKENMVNAARQIDMASRIMDEGKVGKVKSVENNELEVILGNGVIALDTDWEVVAQSDETIPMKTTDPLMVSEGDVVVIQDENLCISRTGSSLTCEVIICRE